VPDETFAQTVKAFGTIVERITPWLLDLGSWIFGALIAFNLLILGSLLTVGPVDRAVLIATAALALALPPNVAGFLLLRLLKDMQNVQLETVAVQSFEEAGFDMPDNRAGPADVARANRRRTRLVLICAYSILALSFLLTIVGVAAALWHMAWWIGLAFLVATVLSQVLVGWVITASPSPSAGSTAPSPASPVPPPPAS
jgi:hypothetical protein